MNDLINITTIVNGAWKQNCYLVTNAQKQLLVIDPGSESEAILHQISKLESKPIAILNTHAHYDHIGAVSAVLQQYQIPFYLHFGDAKLMKQANLYKILFESKNSISIPSFDKDLAHESNDLVIGEFAIKVMHTPGHTSGSTCFLLGGNLFGGDTLLPKGPGRTDLPGGNKIDLKESLLKLHELPSDCLVYPGHGKPFTLKEFWNLSHE